MDVDNLLWPLNTLEVCIKIPHSKILPDTFISPMKIGEIFLIIVPVAVKNENSIFIDFPTVW